jgi:hypothetical protein
VRWGWGFLAFVCVFQGLWAQPPLDCSELLKRQKKWMHTSDIPVFSVQGIGLAGNIVEQDSCLWFFPLYEEPILLAEGQPLRWVRGARLSKKGLRLDFVRVELPPTNQPRPLN